MPTDTHKPKTHEAEYQQELMSRINERRVELIRKKDPSSDEKRELLELQAKMSVYVNAQYPLPFPALERLEEYAEQLKARVNR